MQNQTEYLEAVFTRLLHYLKETEHGQVPVVEFQDSENLQSRLDLAIVEDGLEDHYLLQYVDDYLRYSVRTGHKKFFNQLFAGFSAHAFAGEMLAAVTNTSMYTYEVAPVATLIEKTIIRKFLDMVGFTTGSGTLTTGGSNANLTAMLCARNRAFPNSKENGVPPGLLIGYVSAQAHYSFQRAADLIGIGSAQLRAIPCDKNGHMVVAELAREIEHTIKLGKQPFFVAATAGTTVLGAFDPIQEIGCIARQHGLWFHIDGAFGGSALLSPTHRALLAGSAEADSFTWDAHKMLGAGLMCSAILLRNPTALLNACAVGGTEYLYHDASDESAEKYPDLGVTSLQCGRRVDALKLWLLWKHYGDTGFSKRIDQIFALAQYAEKIVRDHPELQLMAPVQSVNVCFRYVPANDDIDLNRLNISIREKLRKDGKSFVNYAYLDGAVVIRLVIVNFALCAADIDSFFQEIISTGHACSAYTAPRDHATASLV